MIVAALLWSWALVLATVGPRALRWGSWQQRSPRVAIAAWLALVASIIAAFAFGWLALAISSAPVSERLSGVLRACAMAIRHTYGTHGGGFSAVIGLLIAAAVLIRWAMSIVTTLAGNRRVRQRHHATLTLVGTSDDVSGVTLVDHAAPVVYCLAGRPHRIVMTSAARAVLDAGQRAAVLAHERAHLRGRHDLLVALATGTARAFPGVWVFRDARDEVTRLVELLADDYASRTTNRLTLAEAMLSLGSAPFPTGALAAAGSPTGDRVRRLIEGRRPLRTHVIAGVSSAVAALLVAPLLTLTVPAVLAENCCSAEGHPSSHPTREVGV